MQVTPFFQNDEQINDEEPEFPIRSTRLRSFDLRDGHIFDKGFQKKPSEKDFLSVNGTGFRRGGKQFEMFFVLFCFQNFKNQLKKYFQTFFTIQKWIEHSIPNIQTLLNLKDHFEFLEMRNIPMLELKMENSEFQKCLNILNFIYR